MPMMNATTLNEAIVEADQHLESGWEFQLMYQHGKAQTGFRYEVRNVHEDKYAITLSDGKLIGKRIKKESYGTGADFVYVAGDKPQDWEGWVFTQPPDPIDELFKFLKQRK